MTTKNNFHTIKINREDDIDPKNTLKIDDKDIKGIRNVKIVFGVDERVPIVTIELYAGELIGQIKSNKIEIISPPMKYGMAKDIKDGSPSKWGCP